MNSQLHAAEKYRLEINKDAIYEVFFHQNFNVPSAVISTVERSKDMGLSASVLNTTSSATISPSSVVYVVSAN